MNEEAKMYEYKVPERIIMRQKRKDPEGMKV